MQTVRFTFADPAKDNAPVAVVFGTTTHDTATLRDMEPHFNDMVEHVGHVLGLALYIDFVEPVNAKEA